MSAANHREEELFLRALNLPDARQREAFLDAACAADEPLLARVRELLASHVASGGPLDRPPAQIIPDTTSDQPFAARPGTIIASRYKLLEMIGEGGMGTVWIAEQSEPVRRKVALKLVKPGMDSRQVVARFNAERQALALMDHPNIAKIFDGGMTEQGRSYFVMEYVKGMPLTDYCDQARLSVRERLQLFVPVCQAVQHAHQKGIIHRDLKPSNILACLYDGQPLPKVIDFGLAKAMHQPLTEQTLHTAHGMMLGTPLYMSPEQAEFNNLDVDTRTDIYSLGVILYELLTGTTPLEKQQFKTAALNEILRLIKEVEPPKPSTRLSGSASLPSIAAQRSLDAAQLRRWVRGELDWIVMKALDKERSRRYETANGLARDIQRFLNEEAVEACPPSASYRLRKFERCKHRAALTTAMGFALLLVAATTLSLCLASWAIRARHGEIVERKRAEDEKSNADGEARRAKDAESLARMESEKANRQVYFTEMALAWEAYREGNTAEARRLVEQHRHSPWTGIEWTILSRELASIGKPWSMTGYMKALALEISADASVLAVGGNNRVTIFDSTGEQTYTTEAWRGDSFFSTAYALSGDGTFLAYRSRQGDIYVRNLKTHQELQVPTNGLEPTCIAFSPDGSQPVLAMGDSHGEIRLVNWRSGNVVRPWEPITTNHTLDRWHKLKDSSNIVFMNRELRKLRFSPDGLFLGAANPDGWLCVWNCSNGELVHAWQHENSTIDLVFSPDRRVVAGCHSRFPHEINLYSLATGERLGTLKGHDGTVYAVKFLNDRQLVSSSRDNTIRIWEIETQRELRTIRGHSHYVGALATNPEDRFLYSASNDGEIWRWNISKILHSGEISARYHTQVGDLETTSDGRRLISAQRSGKQVQVWDLATHHLIDELSFDTQINPITVSSSDVLAVGGIGVVYLHHLRSGRRCRIEGPLDSEIQGLDFAPDGNLLAATDIKQTPCLVVWDLENLDWEASEKLQPVFVQDLEEESVSRVRWSPNGSLLAGAGQGGVSLWNRNDKWSRWRDGSHQDSASCVAWSPDSKVLASGSGDASIQLLDVATKTGRPLPRAHAGRVWSIAFSDDGTAIISTSGDDTVGIWDVETGELRARLPGHIDSAFSLLLTHDKKRLITGGLWDGKIRIWRLD